MKVIGLTGGIGTGKSTVSAYLKERGCHIVDADAISRNITTPGNPAMDEIRQAFGAEVFLEDGALNRKMVGEIVFADPEKKRILENIITRRAIEETLQQIADLQDSGDTGIIIMDAPLIFECDLDQHCDETWVVDADLDVRILRVMARDGLSREHILARIANQMSDDEKRQRADFIIDNSGTLPELYEQIDRLLERVTDDYRKGKENL